jgi:uncharacterized protein YndB with AHSA1/START domain
MAGRSEAWFTQSMNASADALDARTLATSRLVTAPRALIYRALIEPAHLINWWGPAGFTNVFDVCLPVPGGDWRFTMIAPDGKEYPNQSTFGTMIENERVVINHESAPKFSLTIELADSGIGTQLSWRQTFETVAARDAVVAVAMPANEQNIDRLQAELWKMR